MLCKHKYGKSYFSTPVEKPVESVKNSKLSTVITGFSSMPPFEEITKIRIFFPIL